MTKEQQKLVEENHNLIYSFLSKHHLSIEEHYDLAAIGLCKAGKTYNEGMSNFSTYAYKCMFNAVMCEIRKYKYQKTIPDSMVVYYQAETQNDAGDITAFLDFIPSNDNVEDSILSEVMFDEYAKTLKDRDKKIFSLLREGYTQKEIGKIVGCSQTQVSRVGKRLREYLQS